MIGGSFGDETIINLPYPLKKVKDEIDFQRRYLLLNKYFKKYDDKIKSLQGVHNDDRCFIVGTGPSLKNTNLGLLKDEIVFGVNSLYKAIDGFSCKYYAMSDMAVWRKHWPEVKKLDSTIFLSAGIARKMVKTTPILNEAKMFPDIILLRTKGYLSVSKEFPKDISKYVSGGHTVITDICLQVAFYMGFREVYLLGTDFSNLGVRFDGSITENLKAVGLTDVNKIFYCLSLCKTEFEKNNRFIYNATPGGCLEIFERRKLEDVV